jgi:hypothetical protein
MDAVNDAGRYSVSTVERALDVLRAFTCRQPELSLTDRRRHSTYKRPLR